MGYVIAVRTIKKRKKMRPRSSVDKTLSRYIDTVFVTMNRGLQKADHQSVKADQPSTTE